jgi:hypothetical protein
MMSGGATYTDCTGNPSLPKMRREIDRFGVGEMQEYTLDEIAEPFLDEGFSESRGASAAI